MLVNGRYAAHRKNDGALVQESGLLDFWENAGVNIAPRELYWIWDPRVLYDPSSQRWFAASLGVHAACWCIGDNDDFLLAVSRSSDPTQGWDGFAIPSDPQASSYTDFTTLGVNVDGVYVGAKELSSTMSTFVGIDLVVIPKGDLLAPTPTVANATLFSKKPWLVAKSPQPVVDLDGGGQPETFINHTGADKVVMSSVSGPVTAPTFGTSIEIPTAYVTSPISADQPGSKPNLRVGGTGFTGSVVKRNGSLWAVQMVLGAKHGNAAVRWYQIDPEQSIRKMVRQSGEIEDPDLDLYYPSIAVNEFNEVVIAMTGSSEAQFPSAYAVAGQTFGGVTTFGELMVAAAGAGDYYVDLVPFWGIGFTGQNRWGDYSATVVDPSDPRTFWTFQQYVSAVDVWSVCATQLSFVGCEGVPDGPTFESLRCRIYGLLDRVNAETALGRFQTKLAKKAGRAGRRVNQALAACRGDNTEKTLKGLEKAAKMLDRHTRILDGAAAIRDLPAALREEYRAAGEAIRPDAELFSTQVACPTDAPW